MNTSGYIRGLLVKNLEFNQLLKKIIETLKREFVKDDINLESVDKGYILYFNEYKVFLDEEAMKSLKGNYSIDRYILESLEEQGYKLDRNRSQYIRYCFDDYVGARIVN